MATRLAALVLALFALSAVPAAAQRDVSIERFQPALDGQGFLGVQGTRTPGAGLVSYGLFTHFGTDLLTVEQADGQRIDLVDRRLGGALSAELGIGPRAALAFAAPFVISQHGDRLGAALPPVQAFALSDPRLSARYRFAGDVPKDPFSRNDGPGLALSVGTDLPAGDTERYAGEGAFRLDAQLLADMHLLDAGIGASVGVRHRFEPRTLFGARLHDELTFGAGLRVPIPPLLPLIGLLEVRGATDFKRAATTAVEGQVGLMWPLGDAMLVLAGGPGFTGGIGAPGARVVLGLWYAPAERDADHDGVPDDVDQCPPLPEDHDGFQDEDGCPDPDNDNDLIPDVDDLCPNEAALEGHDADEDGCTDPR